MSALHLRLLLFAAVLGVASLIAPAPMPVLPVHGEGVLFLSSNTDVGLDAEQSLARHRSDDHRRGRDLVRSVLADLGVRRADIRDGVGDWADGSENSLVVRVSRGVSPVTMRRAAAKFGLLASQKAVLIFRPDASGRDALHVVETPAPMHVVRARLDRHGLDDRTLVVTPGGVRVLVVDIGGERGGDFRDLTRSVGGRGATTRGRADLLAGPTRAEAAARYREVLDEE